jgi:hypothetical protein
MEQRSFAFTVEGQYYGAHSTTGQPTIRNYQCTFKLLSLEGALSIIVKYLLEPYLTKNYEDYCRFRTHKIVGMEVFGPKPNTAVLQLSFEDMSVNELADFCILKRIFIDPHKHKDLQKVREEVARIYQNRVDQKRQDEKSGKAAEQKEIDALLALNNIPKLDNNGVNLNMQRVGAAIKNAGDGRTIEKVGFEAIGSTPKKDLPAESTAPVLEAPVPVGNTGATMEEEPVNNDPAITAKAFDDAAAKHLGLEPAPDDIFA